MQNVTKNIRNPEQEFSKNFWTYTENKQISKNTQILPLF